MFRFCRWSLVAQAGFDLVGYLRMTLNSWPLHLHLSNVGITVMWHHNEKKVHSCLIH